jgi:hypothetical protein
MEVYVVMLFGCNSRASHLWIPETWVYNNYNEAYDKYLYVRPDPNDKENIATIIRLDNGDEACIQDPGYHEGNSNCAKRPYGAKIEKRKISI